MAATSGQTLSKKIVAEVLPCCNCRVLRNELSWRIETAGNVCVMRQLVRGGAWCVVQSMGKTFIIVDSGT